MVQILAKRYNPKDIEKKWHEKWKKENLYRFNADSEKEIFSIDTPPPFTSGTLHMGHIYNHTWIDIVARYKRMRGYEVYFPQGFDCHGLPTELRVEREMNVKKEDRVLFINKCKEWTNIAIKRMKKQFEDIGYSADWSYTYKTMDDSYKKLIQETLIEFYKRGILYRGKHPVLWCPKCETALAKAEVGYIEREGNLYYIDLDSNGHKLTIATTRPEMMPACVAVFVHPEDKRYEKFVGRKAKLPIFNREVPILADENVDMKFGTGAVYLCTFGDEQDIEWQKKYRLPIIEIIDRKGNLTSEAGKYANLSIEDARRMIVEDLIEKGYVRKIKRIRHSVLSHTERSSCKTPIELLPLNQWFINVRDYIEDIIKTAKKMRWYPKYMLQRLIDWSNSMDWDWIISRQRVFGTPIPFWICECGNIISAEDFGLKLPVDPRGDIRTCPKCNGKAVGVKDVCDCWIDSSVTPLIISKWRVNDNFFKNTYPSSLRPQGYEIIRTWAFYTIYRCMILTGKKCFDELLINGMVAGPDGRKMSKSLGNVIEPEEPLKKYSADTIRQWAAGGSLGDDYPFSWEECDHSQRFLTKLWNISRFIEMHLKDFKEIKNNDKIEFRDIDLWIISKLQNLIENCTKNLDNYIFNVPLTDIRSFIWHDLADNYIEMVKHRLYKSEIYGEKSRYAVQYTLNYVLKTILLLLSPFTPHICDEIWNSIYDGYASISNWPEVKKGLMNKRIEKNGDLAIKVLSEIRRYKSENKIPLNNELRKVELIINTKLTREFKRFEEDIKATGRIKEMNIINSDNVDEFEIIISAM